VPYQNIVWVKFKLELLCDYRFTDVLNDRQKLLYLGLLLLAGESKNHVKNDENYIKRRLNLEAKPEDIKSDIHVLISEFPKMVILNNHICFKNFRKLHNWKEEKNREINRKLIGNERESQEEEEEEDKEEDKEKEEERPALLEERFPHLKDKSFQKTFDDYIDMRKKIRKAATGRAAEMVLNQLQGHPLRIAIKMLEKSILNSWQGVFEIKDTKTETVKKIIERRDHAIGLSSNRL
jgi:hypothetical protein